MLISEVFRGNVAVDMLRLDQYPEIPGGNKYFKLLYNIKEAKKQQKDILLTFGGAFSNHLIATAEAGKKHCLQTIGIVRGEPSGKPSTTLERCKQLGMQLFFCRRTHYREIRSMIRHPSAGDSLTDRLIHIPELRDVLVSFKNRLYILPEGGTNTLAVKGCATILDPVDTSYDYYAVPVGTGGTMSGILQAVNDPDRVIGFAAVRDQSLPKEIEKYTGILASAIQINDQYTFGGFAKWNTNLIDFIRQFEEKHAIALDPIYTGKMMYGITNMISSGIFRKGSSILALHTGGLQGVEGVEQRYQQKLK